MIATPHFVYLHLHKSGGTFVNDCLMRFVPGARELGYHLPRRMIPGPLRALPVLGFVRNPWAYYVSWYAFQSAMKQPNHLFRCVSRGGSLPFKRTLHNLLTLGSDAIGFDEVLAGLPLEYTSAGLNLTRAALEPLRGRSVGFYSYLYEYMFGGPGPAPRIGRTETLRDDFLALLRDLGVEVSAGMAEYVATESARNTSSHAHWSTYYDDESRAWVAQHDAGLIDAHGYRFEVAGP
jgi:hypothetical protein